MYLGRATRSERKNATTKGGSEACQYQRLGEKDEQVAIVAKQTETQLMRCSGFRRSLAQPKGDHFPPTYRQHALHGDLPSSVE